MALGLAVLAAAVQLALAFFALRAERNRLSMPLAAFCLVSAAWTLAAAAYVTTESIIWKRIDPAISPLLIPLALWFVLRFCGRTERYRLALGLVGYASVGLGLVSFGALFSNDLGILDNFLWSPAYLVLLAVTVATGGAILVGHYRARPDASERIRTLVLLAALVLGAALGSTEMLNDVGVDVPGMGTAATLVTALLLALLALKWELLPSRPLLGTAMFFFSTLGSLAVIYVVLGRALGPTTATFAVAMLGVLVFAAFAVLRFAREHARVSLRAEKLAFLGQLSDQMAHDLRNPVAAIKGAADYLVEEGSQIGSEPSKMLQLISEQSRRLEALLDSYRRIGRVEAQPVWAPIHPWVERVTNASWANSKTETMLETDETLTDALHDPELLEVALENLLRNAVEASEPGSKVQVRVKAEGGQLTLSVQDSGKGMNARELEQATQLLYTTKAQGSGLGLSFADRVAQAHGGTLTVTSVEGKGTRATMTLPQKGTR